MTDTNANTALWDRLKRTDPKATKPFTKSGGFRGTQIDPTYRLQLMTEVLGPVGQGWGYVEDDLKISHDMAFSKVRVWYVPDGASAAQWPEGWRETYPANARWTGPQWGGTEMMPERSGKAKPTDECLKMSITDALGKCLLQLGLAADVYMGQFDDSKYREESEAIFAARSNPDLQPAAIEAFEAEVKRRVDACIDLDDLEEVWRSGVGSRLREIANVDKAAQARVNGLFSQKKADILKKEDAAAATQDNKPAAPPPPTAEPIILFLAEGEVKEFPRTLKGAEAYFNTLDDLIRGDRYFWTTNAPTAEKLSADLMTKAPHIARMLDGIKAMLVPAAAE
ncbi:hypothetical protein [Azospirillum sp. TSA6c]|uniref:hypothetical protein n=1 Tax=Azospirillum sp. TSA6c TaxID=709813 RepID=UPI0018EE6E68|nr:hypothetical protein [Azospirillum sp. TSA6c]